MAFSFNKKKVSPGAADGAAVSGDAAAKPEKKKGKVSNRTKIKSKKEYKPNKSKANRFVLIVGDEGCILVFIQGNKVVRRLFAPSAQPSHTEAMRELMRNNTNVPIYLLVDVMDQQYLPQPFPPVSQLSIRGLVQRRLNQSFPPEDLKGALPLGRDKSGRKEWKFLLVGLAKTVLITEWLDMVVELPNEMKGVYLAPIESIGYIEMLNRSLGNHEPRDWQLLISHNKVSGFRQVVTHEGKLVFTRISQAIDEAVPAVVAGNIEQEIINTIEYIKRLDFKENNQLDATVIVSRDVIDSLDLQRFSFATANTLAPIQVSEMLGFEQAAMSADRFGDVVMATAFGVSKKRYLRFATAYIDKLAKVYQAQVGVKVVAACIVLCLVGLILMAGVDIFSDRQAIQKAEQERASQAAMLHKLEASVKGLQSDVAFKSAAVASYDAYIKDAPSHRDFLRSLMGLVSEKTRIIELSWTSKQGLAPGNSAPNNQAGDLPVEIELKVDFSKSGRKPEELTAAAKLFQGGLEKLNYEVINAVYPWETVAANSGGSFDLMQETVIGDQDKIAMFTLRGPKKKAGQP